MTLYINSIVQKMPLRSARVVKFLARAPLADIENLPFSSTWCHGRDDKIAPRTQLAAAYLVRARPNLAQISAVVCILSPAFRAIVSGTARCLFSGR